MEKEFVPYEQALALKELGFDGGCFSLYFNNGEFSNFIHAYKVNDEVVEKTNSIPAPTFSQAFRWFREKYNLHIPIKKVVSNANTVKEVISWTIVNSPWDSFPTYEEAELACLDKLIEVVKNKN